MKARAVARGIRMSPRKARLVVDLVRGKSVGNALEMLSLARQKAATPVRKTILSAMHNLAEQSDHPIEPSEMKISEIYVDEGRTMQRIRPRAQGRAFRIRKRSSHVTVVVEHETEKK